jgi:hypothetical protein
MKSQRRKENEEENTKGNEKGKSAAEKRDEIFVARQHRTHHS